MPKVLTARQRAFAIEKARGKTNEEAAEDAGYRGATASLRTTGSRLSHMPHVRAEINRIQSQAAEESGITIIKVLMDLEKTRERAFEEGSYSAATRCSELQGNYIGMWTKNHRLTTLDKNGQDTGLKVVCIPLVNLGDIVEDIVGDE